MFPLKVTCKRMFCHDVNQIYLTVDCKWSEWTSGDCSVSCGDGLRINTRSKLTEALYGGAPCIGENKMTEKCLARICPGKPSTKKEIA